MGGTVVYRLAPSLAARLVGATLLLAAVLVLLTTALTLVADLAWQVTPVVAAVGVVAVGVLALWLLRVAWVVRLTPDGYAVRLLRAPGARACDWAGVSEAVAASPQGVPCLVLRLRDGRATCVPIAVLAADGDDFARDVRRRLRDAHTPDPDSAAEPESL